ncbi:hypothetical protein CKY10_03825 [Photorhabdus sp. HUG-39]|uniref:VENN motif-containing domain-containing protein n=1 Tax=Photorhabdus kayaii TaxID=230088 RepID=A0ABX0AWY6_9GAMM|nr:MULTISPECIES: VENN motif pre-toxin domain-containing protein [Photorhabdus]MCC8376622.1 VENN motif pre-toxin domain-containing protein [Photorhabdus bodei]MCC8466780.1 VENN motif pre-toxin domain-containing protein [Photorhabdus bodei]MCT8354610.1 VENN motif pre-toxin domain-containing protein [Photorhabdus kayaii]MDB6366325.1 VENN motif pre-toxin domain-containing protein [Photorhabdus bodei]NDL10931.1 hypothetical protein [Photorhabdus kayaii]
MSSTLAGGIAGDSTASALTGAQAGKNSVDNNALSMGSLFGSESAKHFEGAGSLAQKMTQSGATPEEINAALTHYLKGQVPEGQDPAKGLIIAWGNFFGVPLDVVLSNEQMTPQKAAEIVAGGIPTSEAKLIQFAAAKAYLSLSKYQSIEAVDRKSSSTIDNLMKEKAQTAKIGEMALGADKNISHTNVNSKASLGTKIDKSIVIVDKEHLPTSVSSTFKAGKYETVITQEPVTLFRKFGGVNDQAKLDGGYATTTQNAGRNETAVYKNWSTTRFEAEIEVPKDTKLNIGSVGEQPPLSNNPKYIGGADQILLPRNYPMDWIKSIRDGKTGNVYTYEEFKKAFPDQITNKGK